MDRIEMTRQQFCQRFGIWPPDDIQSYFFYSVDGVLTSEIMLIDDPTVAQAEVEWLEKLYAL